MQWLKRILHFGDSQGPHEHEATGEGYRRPLTSGGYSPAERFDESRRQFQMAACDDWAAELARYGIRSDR